ncbi:soluble lytic murein transglycosylase precursor [Variibacter gotjawalensis]|uniref:Soluble lytic murein transglycosylase n=1 Tax=Variibacter gotjawalensis TaxID=1333996 RepID=A0A0S3PXY5_9BRAD|nr:lytic transglycosylase domain-containing protein [Variibacter gotjawalensis]NIK46574.1 soluble lytic murein transglycosylase [Variibacter gotjawalensis]RZS48478.1 soluble lytic murein transglycosylase [Variibacter gotjawalensis]BAT60740.1 soluble lytic murein transglycosylase precursor [Variibacter gotjawalensis]
MTRFARTCLASASALAIALVLSSPAAHSQTTTNQKPAATKPNQKPDGKKADAKKPEPKKTEPEKTEAKKLDPKKPDAKADAKKPAKPDAKKTTATAPVAKPAAKPAAAKPATKPVVAATPANRRPSAAPMTGSMAAPVAAPAYQAAEPEATPQQSNNFFGNAFSASPTVAPTATASAGNIPDEETPRLSYAPTGAVSSSDIDTVKEALSLAKSGRTDAATEKRDQIRDAAGQKLIEWMILRGDDSSANFARYASFAKANPSWPSVRMIQRRAESQMWREKREPGAVFAFFSDQEPAGSTGKLAYARAALAQGDRANAQKYVRAAWREDDFGPDTEAQAMETFGGMITAADQKARMDARLYAEDHETALRAAKRLGSTELAIAQARIAVNRKAGNAGALISAAGGRSDAGLTFSRIQYLRRADKTSEAAQLMLSAPRDADVILNTDEWWIERRLLARKLLDEGNAQAAYRIASGAARPEKKTLQTEQSFTAGWIALRFLKDASSAQRHFAEILKFDKHPTSMARAHYWLGRTAETAGRSGEAQSHYQQAAQHSAAYYGQLARARIGHREMTVRRPNRSGGRTVDLARALDLIYLTGNRDLAITFCADLERVGDSDALAALGEVAMKHNDPRATMMIGKAAIARGLPFDHYAFPTSGIPKYASIGNDADKSTVFAIARQESAFNSRAISSARAMGLMQVMPGTGRMVAKKHGVAFSESKLLNDAAFNAQVGAAELGALLQDFGGSHVLTFAAYNAGRGRAREWIQKYGDPRDPDVDVVDWVERIPFSETRNYVQRVMENMQVYKARFGATRLAIDSDMRGSRTQ